MSDESCYFISHPQTRVVRGWKGMAIHDVASPQLFWIRNNDVAQALCDSLKGMSTNDALKRRPASAEEFLATLAFLEEQGLGRLTEKPMAGEVYRPVLLQSQADKASIWRPCVLEVEIANECSYDCVHCSAKPDSLHHKACSCGVWPASQKPLESDALREAIEDACYGAVNGIIVRGGDPLLEMEQLAVVLCVAHTFGVSVEVHCTAALLDEENIALLKEHDVQLVLMAAGMDKESFDHRSGLHGAWEKFQQALALLRTAGQPFSVKLVSDMALNEDPKAWASENKLSIHEHILFASDLEQQRPAYMEAIRSHRTPKFAVGMEDFARNGQNYACFDRHIYISADGQLLPCLGWRESMGNLHEKTMHDLLREDVLKSLTSYGRSETESCRGCEFRNGCWSCLVRTQEQRGDAKARHWDCSYDPRAGEVL